ncbi:Helicase associated domain protein [Streptomyces sp. NPDC059909]|uniref:helicase associated domain-containing protein n=1 Tax=Streptomyces sp. NPDC059909 TaxID=3346998 RepID=UPI00365BE715
MTDPAYQSAVLRGVDAGSEEMRGARLAALQTALVKAAAEQNLTRTLVFHHRIAEAEAFAAGLPDVAAKLHASDPELYPKTVWAQWLSGDHRPGHRKRVLDEFASQIAPDRTVVEKSFLSSVKVLGEGVDTAQCDSVFFADVRGSMPDLVQAVGRALRMHPGEDKTASLVVPVLLAPGETPETMLTSKAYDGLARLLEALRAHDARIVEQLAEPQAPSRYTPAAERPEHEAGMGEVSARAAGLLQFSTPRDPAQLAAFVELRVINPEREHWRRGIDAALTYTRAHGDLKVPYDFTVPDTDHWPAGLAGFPLGRWIAEARRAYGQGRLDEDRIEQLDRLGMIWSPFDVAFEEGLTAARAWAGEHGHLLAPVDATWNGYPVGVWLKNQRAAARRTDIEAQDREQDLPPGETRQRDGGPVTALSDERREALDDIDPSWCPAWPLAWQRCFHLTRLHVHASGALPTTPGNVVRQGEDLGRWVRAQQLGWHRLTTVQQWMCRQVLGIEPAAKNEKPKPRRSHRDKWAINLAAATQFCNREGHLRVPRKHIETMSVSVDSPDSQGPHEVRLGVWVSNLRSRAASLTPEQVEQLSGIGMRWT